LLGGGGKGRGGEEKACENRQNTFPSCLPCAVDHAVPPLTIFPHHKPKCDEEQACRLTPA
jgi:hypothetical protein